MKVLVTGGAGFIGSHLCERLLAEGHDVMCVDNFDPYYSPERKEKNVSELLNNDRFRLYRTDIRDFGELKKVFEENGVEVVIHLGGKVGVRASLLNPKEYGEVNIGGTINMLELSKLFGVKKFFYGSSSSVYGNTKKIPFSEDAPVDCPISTYAATKKAAELMCYAYHSLYGLKVVCFRFFTVYGPRGRPEMAIYKFTKLISEGKEIEKYGDGSSKRDYTFVSDVIDGVMAALNKDFGFEIINLGNNSPVELNYLISLIEEEVGKKAKIRQLPEQAGDVEVTYADVSKAKELLGYAPKVKIGEGIKRFVKWFKNEN
jgi:UDP-glucuronate 4-epimerase